MTTVRDRGRPTRTVRSRRPASPERGTLDRFVHRPAVLPARPALVVVLHGCTQTARGYARDAGWLELADREGFVVLAPEQTRAGNANLCFNWFTDQHGGAEGEEVLAILAMIDDLIASDGLDPSRVFATGLSAGGAMAFALLIHHPQVFAGGGVIAGLPAGVAKTTAQALALMRGQSPAGASIPRPQVTLAPGQAPRLSIWHGTADHIVAPVNADAIAAQWMDLAGLTADPNRSERDGTRRRQVWTDTSGSPALEINRLIGFGHATPLSTGGAQGLGHAAPHLVDCGHSSTRELAVFWGLIDACAHASSAWTLDVVPPAPSARPDGSASSPLTFGLRNDIVSGLPPQVPDRVRDLIDRTLRQAGL